MNSKDMVEFAKKRRSYRSFTDEAVDIEIIKDCISVATTAPNGANKQPWHFVVVKDSEVKKTLRDKCENIEKEFYEKKISKEWADDLSHLNVNYQKPFLEEAAYLIVVFKEMYKTLPDGTLDKNYYVNESSGIAIGFLLYALHQMGLQSLTYTPAPMNFLKEYFKRPDGEIPVMIIATGKGSSEYQLPELTKKSFEEIAQII